MTSSLSRARAQVAIGSVAILALAACSSSANSGDYPADDNITIIVPYDPGGPNDVAARAVSPCLEDELDATVVVENRPGGGGTIGLKEVADSEPDGYTLGVASVSTAVVAPLEAGDVGFTYQDLAPIGLLAITPSLLVVQSNSEYESADDFFADAEANPEEIKVGIPATFYDAELRRLEKLYDVTFTRVPFDGTSGAVSALLGNNVDAVFGAADTATMEQVDTGEFRPLATGSATPVDYLDNVPTLISLGYDDLNLSDSVIGLAAPDGTPNSVMKQLASALKTCSHSDEMKETLGEEYLPKDFIDGTQVQKLFAKADESFRPVFQ